jgi:hypothetical protein
MNLSKRSLRWRRDQLDPATRVNLPRLAPRRLRKISPRAALLLRLKKLKKPMTMMCLLRLRMKKKSEARADVEGKNKSQADDEGCSSPTKEK